MKSLSKDRQPKKYHKVEKMHDWSKKVASIAPYLIPYSEKERKESIKHLKKEIKKANFELFACNSHIGSCADHGQTKHMYILYPAINSHTKKLEINRLSPYTMLAIGFSSHMEKKSFKDQQWYNPVIGMDRGFDVIYKISHFLYGNGYTIRSRWI